MRSRVALYKDPAAAVAAAVAGGDGGPGSEMGDAGSEGADLPEVLGGERLLLAPTLLCSEGPSHTFPALPAPRCNGVLCPLPLSPPKTHTHTQVPLEELLDDLAALDLEDEVAEAGGGGGGSVQQQLPSGGGGWGGGDAMEH